MLKKIFQITFILAVILFSSLVYAENLCPSPGACNTVGAQIINEINHTQGFSFQSNSVGGDFVYPGNPHSVQLPTYFTDPRTRNFNNFPILSIVQFKTTFHYEELLQIIDDEDVDLFVDSTTKKLKTPKYYTIHVLFPIKGVLPPVGIMKAHITGKSPSFDEANSFKCFAKSMLEAMYYGANVVYLTGEGSQRAVKAWGAGVGTSGTFGHLSEDRDDSSVASAGSGFSWGSATYEEMAHVHVIALEMTYAGIAKRKNDVRFVEQNMKKEQVKDVNGKVKVFTEGKGG